jgi:hypothetical protein
MSNPISIAGAECVMAPTAMRSNAGQGDGADGFDRDAARGFQLRLLINAVAHLDGGLHAGAVHVVEQDYVDPVDLQHFLELLEGIDFHFHQPLRILAAAARDDAGEKAR